MIAEPDWNDDVAINRMEGVWNGLSKNSKLVFLTYWQLLSVSKERLTSKLEFLRDLFGQECERLCLIPTYVPPAERFSKTTIEDVYALEKLYPYHRHLQIIDRVNHDRNARVLIQLQLKLDAKNKARPNQKATYLQQESRKRCLILNFDEYDKTVKDFAIKCGVDPVMAKLFLSEVKLSTNEANEKFRRTAKLMNLM